MGVWQMGLNDSFFYVYDSAMRYGEYCADK